MKKYKGCVYFLRHIGLSPIKIGMSNSDDLSQRINAYKTASPYGIELLGTIPTNNAFQLEQELHKKFDVYRVNGEWFEISEEIVKSMILLHSNKEIIELRNKIEETLNSKTSVKKEANKIDYNLFDLNFLNEYSNIDLGLGFDVLNCKEIMNKYNIVEERTIRLSNHIKSLGFNYRAFSTKKGIKKGFRLFKR